MSIPVMLSGGRPGVRTVVAPADDLAPTDRDPGQAETVDIAPTAAWLLGRRAPADGVAGRVLRKAFTRPTPSRRQS